MTEPLTKSDETKPAYTSHNFAEFAAEQKAKGLKRKFWPRLPQMWREEQAFRQEFEKALHRLAKRQRV